MKKNKTGLFILGGVLVVILAIGGYFVSTYNSLASAENNVDAKWSQVENVMQRRADLIPNLVNSVQGSMDQEKEVFKQITEARKEYNGAGTPQEKVNANAKIDQSLGTMINVIQESYPQLASNENVKTLMVQLEGTENRISVERKNYIDEVQKYNQNLVRFPKNIVARTMGFEKKVNFKADDKAKEVPDVSFK
ncbi:LemA family protein [Enterococcus rivorum]|uniref:LemA family protein n=1 Tax=Enterococcus rivorum TaxID=762845 RepID=A0A1E5L1A7_9ENTE|nr:LemA family protein [Enterococcus rivorum]MBP2098612.1 LemA protein [Enterococcus rivorum]OEH83887.1 LemA family protein [Enterococcus rivorum]